MDNLFALDGKAAIVTGASSGLGRHIAKTLARAGAKVALAARRVDQLSELAQEIEAAGGRALPVALDVTDAGSVAEAVRIAEEELGPIGILVNNAGVPPTKSALEMDEAEWDRVVGTNLKGAWLVAGEVARHMSRLGHGGRIINVASVIGHKIAAKGTQSYGMAKAGLIAMTETMALELGREGILVNAIAPGYVITELNEGFLTSEAGARIQKRVPLGRFGEAGDLDGAILLLASDAGRYITGSTFVIDGGLTLTSL